MKEKEENVSETGKKMFSLSLLIPRDGILDFGSGGENGLTGTG